MTYKDGVVYLQAGECLPVVCQETGLELMTVGGGIVFDSVEEDEYIETINKLGANVKCIEEAESESRDNSNALADASAQNTMLRCKARLFE